MTTEDQHKTRRRFLLLMAALGLSFVTLRDRVKHQLVGLIVTMPPGAALRGQIHWELAHLQHELESEFQGRQAASVEFGAAMGGSVYPSAAAVAVADKVVKDGALGVPFSAVATAAIVATANAISGEVMRSKLETKSTTDKITQAVSASLEKLINKLTNEAVTQLNAAFVAATNETITDNPRVEEMLYVLNPLSDNHCPWCSAHTGNVYQKDHPVWQQLPRHAGCYCYGMPIFSRSEVESNQELVTA